MKYYIYDRADDSRRTYDTWWNLVGFFYSGGEYGYYYGCSNPINNIAHNDNDGYFTSDVMPCWDDTLQSYRRITTRRWEHLRYTVYDDYARIINKADIKMAFKDYDPNIKTGVKKKKKKKRHPYRRYFWHGYRDNIHRNKRYVAELMGYRDLFPSDSSITDAYWFVKTWSDDIPGRSTHKNWKCQSKKRKQWE